MRIAIVSCYAYRDAWKPFFELLYKFWPECRQNKISLLTDVDVDDGRGVPADIAKATFKTDAPWSRMLSSFAMRDDSDVLVMQEDFFLTAPVRQDLIEHALEQMKARNAGMVRLYPCPGADEEYGDPHFGIVKKGSRYRISCQVSIWRPDYLHAIASRFKTPAEFEIHGTEFAETLPDEVLAFKRDSGPWPLEYLCSGISRGKWNPDAKKLFEQHGIMADYSLREMELAR